MISAVIFDIDGTLVDSVDLHARAWVEAFEHFGKMVEFSAIRSQIGKGGDELMPVFLTKAEVDSIGDKLSKFRDITFQQKYLSKVKPFPNVRGMMQRVLEGGQRIALGSSARKEEAEHYMSLCNIKDLVEVVTSTEDAERSKPNPDIFEAALVKLGETASRTIVVGDAPYDAEAATKAGMQSIGFLSGGFDQASLEKAGAGAIYRDATDLMNQYSSSPLVLFSPKSR